MPEQDGQGKSDRLPGDFSRHPKGDGEELGLRTSEADGIGVGDGQDGDRPTKKPGTVKKSYYISPDNAQWIKLEALRRLSNESRIVDAILNDARLKTVEEE